MSEVIKPTPGGWHFGGVNRCTIYDRFGQRIANSFEGVMAVQRSDSECKANAAFIAEAGTVYHETGLMPRQLVEQRDALVRELEAVRDWAVTERAALRKQEIDSIDCALALVKGAKP